MQPQPLCKEVLLEKYAQGDERSCRDVRVRVARALAEVEAPGARMDWERRFLVALERGFIPAGRINAAVGTTRNATLINCFVQPVGDSISQADQDGYPGIYTALSEAVETMRLGGGVGYDFSRIRPAGARVCRAQLTSSGPLRYMRVFDRACESVSSFGARRGAQMGVLRCDHPDIEAFIHAKDQGDLSNFNLSVGVTDAFMRAVEQGEAVDLMHRAEPGPEIKSTGVHQGDDGLWVYKRVFARELWEQIMHCAYDHAEPGVLFLDRINEDNNLHYCESIAATNPCAEQPLPAYGGCCLGSMDLTRFVRDPFDPGASFDAQAFESTCKVAIRMLDNVLDLSWWPLPQQRDEAHQKRRVGLGFTGLGDALVMLNLAYDSPQACLQAQKIAQLMRDAAYEASIDLAVERGPFPKFCADQYLGGKSFASRLPAALRVRIGQHGLRNSHLLSIAPAGTISLAFADNVSPGVEPIHGWVYHRKKRLPNGRYQDHEVEDHAWRLYRHLKGPQTSLTPAFVCAPQISAQAHIDMVAAVAPYIDAAISKTVNLPADTPFEHVEGLYLRAWRAGLKGLTIYRPNAVLGPTIFG